MIAFAKLVDQLYYTSSNLSKASLIKAYLSLTNTQDRGWAIAAIAGTLSFEFFKRKAIKDLITERVDPVLFELSYDYVGEMSETVAHLWEAQEQDPPAPQLDANGSIPSLTAIVEHFQEIKKAQVNDSLIGLLNLLDAPQRWALIKLGTRGLRIGVSARFIKKVLAEYGEEHAISRGINAQEAATTYSIEEIERLWHGLKAPYVELFDWLEGKGSKPDVSGAITFQPVMLSHPIDEAELTSMKAKDWTVEWKFDGIRVQLVSKQNGKALFSRTGDDISHSFPDLLDSIDNTKIIGVFDGELLALKAPESDAQQVFEIASFNQLQQRLNKKKPSNKLMRENPAGIMIYDALSIADDDLRELPLSARKQSLLNWFSQHGFRQANTNRLAISKTMNFETLDDLSMLRQQATSQPNGYIEGLMLKRNDSVYSAGRPKGKWYKWKRDPLVIDAVMMYAQRGHGKRSSFYSDYTFGCWHKDTLLPVGKAYSGFTDEELKEIDKWVRKNTIGRFGPVKEVKKTLVFELAFDSVHPSNRHKSGVAMRFPRVHRIRWDKPANEADHVDTLAALGGFER